MCPEVGGDADNVTGTTVYCECYDIVNMTCAAGLDVSTCPLTVLDSGDDVTQFYIDQALPPIGCDDPTELGPEHQFGADLNFVPDVSWDKVYVYAYMYATDVSWDFTEIAACH